MFTFLFFSVFHFYIFPCLSWTLQLFFIPFFHMHSYFLYKQEPVLEQFIELLSTIKCPFYEMSVQVTISSFMSSLIIIYVSLKPGTPQISSAILCCHHIQISPLNLFMFFLVSIFFTSYFHHSCIWIAYLTKANLWNVCSVFLFFVCLCKFYWKWN